MAANNASCHHTEAEHNAAIPKHGEIVQDSTSGVAASSHQSHQGANRYVLTSIPHQIAPDVSSVTVSSVVDPTQTFQFGPGTDFETYDDFFLPNWKSWNGPYESMLEFLVAQGLVEELPVDECGVLHVSVPFCSAFMECQTLSAFLSETFLTKPGVSKVSILGTDLIFNASYCWDRKENYVAKKYPNMSLQLRQMDLAEEPLPKCALSLGIHPEANAGTDCWRHILANVIKNTNGGVCAFATFFEGEVQAVLKACRPWGVNFEVHENPYYKSHPIGNPPFLRFILVGSVPQVVIESPQPTIIDNTQEGTAEEPKIEYVDLFIEVPVLKHRLVPVVTVKKKYVEVPVPMMTEVKQVEHQRHVPLVTGKRTIVDVPHFEIITKAQKTRESPQLVVTDHYNPSRVLQLQKVVEVSDVHYVRGSEKIAVNVRQTGKPSGEANKKSTHGLTSSALSACMRFAACLPVHACFPNRAR